MNFDGFWWILVDFDEFRWILGNMYQKRLFGDHVLQSMQQLEIEVCEVMPTSATMSAVEHIYYTATVPRCTVDMDVSNWTHISD